MAWRKAKVQRDWHIQIDTVKYSVPFRFAGHPVDVRIIGDTLDVIADGETVATHRRGCCRSLILPMAASLVLPSVFRGVGGHRGVLVGGVAASSAA